MPKPKLVNVSFKVSEEVRDMITEMQPRNYSKSQVVSDAVRAAYVWYKAGKAAKAETANQAES